MRRFFIVSGILLPVFFLLSGCNKGCEINSRPILNFIGDLEIISEASPLYAKITQTEDYTQIEITSPENLNGLQITHRQTDTSISQNGLSYKADGLVLPRESEISLLFEVFDFIKSNADEEPFFKDLSEMAFIGKTSSGKFELRADRKNGLITEIKIDDKATIKFSNQEAL